MPADPNNCSDEADVIADFLLTHIGGDEGDQWQAGHNYAMREAARLIREQQHLLGYGRVMDCLDCGAPPPHTQARSAPMVECGGWPLDDAPGERATCGASWRIDQRGLFSANDDDGG